MLYLCPSLLLLQELLYFLLLFCVNTLIFFNFSFNQLVFQYQRFWYVPLVVVGNQGGHPISILRTLAVKELANISNPEQADELIENFKPSTKSSIELHLSIFWSCLFFNIHLIAFLLKRKFVS